MTHEKISKVFRIKMVLAWIENWKLYQKNELFCKNFVQKKRKLNNQNPLKYREFKTVRLCGKFRVPIYTRIIKAKIHGGGCHFYNSYLPYIIYASIIKAKIHGGGYHFYNSYIPYIIYARIIKAKIHGGGYHFYNSYIPYIIYARIIKAKIHGVGCHFFD